MEPIFLQFSILLDPIYPGSSFWILKTILTSSPTLLPRAHELPRCADTTSYIYLKSIHFSLPCAIIHIDINITIHNSLLQGSLPFSQVALLDTATVRKTQMPTSFQLTWRKNQHLRILLSFLSVSCMLCLYHKLSLIFSHLVHDLEYSLPFPLTDFYLYLRL